uniref:hypothetical protein n=1 Tax=Klebsiella pneumoniae TaxID=573 RepID=UPI003704A8B0
MSANFNCQIVSTEQSEAVITGEDAVTTILEQLESAGIRWNHNAVLVIAVHVDSRKNRVK